MRVAIAAESFLPHVNGVTNSVLRVLEHLRAVGHQAVVLAPAAGAPASYAGFEVVGLPCVPLPGYSQVRVTMSTRPTIARVLADFRPDVVHLASPFALGYRAAQASRWFGLPVVGVYQTDLPGYARRYGFPAAEPLLWSALRRIHSLATLNLAPSSAARTQLLAAGIGNVEVWGRGVDTERFDPGRRTSRVRAQLCADPDRPLIGYVGRLAAEKQVADLAVLADLGQLVIIGDGPARADLERVLPNAKFTGHLGGEDLADALAAVDVMVHPGELETFGQSIQEALASGVPVIAPASGGPLDLIRPSHNGWLYRPGDLRSMRDFVADLLGDPRKRLAFAAAARAGVERRRWSDVCAELVGYYEQAVLRGPAPALRPLERLRVPTELPPVPVHR